MNPDADSRYGERLDEALQHLSEDVEDNPNSTQGIVAQTLLTEVDRMREALLLIAFPDDPLHCENSTAAEHVCRVPGSGRVKGDPRGTYISWCDACIAADALQMPLPVLRPLWGV